MVSADMRGASASLLYGKLGNLCSIASSSVCDYTIMISTFDDFQIYIFAKVPTEGIRTKPNERKHRPETSALE
jgi:hypothetical protein